MKLAAIVATSILLSGGVAFAQTDPDATDPDGEEVPPPLDNPPPRRVDAPPPQRTYTAPAQIRPEGFSIGIGAGFRLPTELTLPNTTSIRFRLGSGLTFEPMLTLSHENVTVEQGNDSITNSTNDIDFALAVRYPLKQSGRVDFSLIGAVEVGTRVSDPEGTENNTSLTLFGLGYGLALDYWLNRHWNISMNATNPVVSVVSTNQQNAAAPDESSTDTTFGAIFGPTVAVMIHLHQ